MIVFIRYLRLRVTTEVFSTEIKKYIFLKPKKFLQFFVWL